MSAFPRVEDVPLVARRPRLSRFDARRRLGLPGGALVLISFGGLGLLGFSPRALAGLAGFHFFAVGSMPFSLVTRSTGAGALGSFAERSAR